MEKKNNKVLLSIIGLAILLISVVGVTYSFFNYTRTGTANTIKIGNISFNSTQDNTISLTNVFPTSSTNLNSTNSDTVTITITGDTTYDDGIEYKVTLEDVNNTINGKTIPISFTTTVTDLGDKDTDYYTKRGGEEAIYNLTETGEVEDGKFILAGYIPAGDDGVDGSIDITAFIDSSNVAISDTVSTIENGNLIYGETPGDWIAGRTVLTTTEWNSLAGNNAISFKVRVEANEGIWVQEEKHYVLANLNSNSNWTSIRANITSIEFHSDGVATANPLSSFDATDVTSKGTVTVYTVDDGLGNNTRKAIIVADDTIYAPGNSSRLFRNMTNLVTFDSKNFKVDNVTNMTQIFQNCSSLTNVDSLIGWNTSNVTGTGFLALFQGCTKLENVDGLLNFDTSKVTYIYSLFDGCKSLKNVNGLGNWNTSSVTNMAKMFSECDSLTDISGLKNWNVANVSNMSYMFSECDSLTDISGLKNWNVANVSDMSYMFYRCHALTDLNALSSWKVSNVTNMSRMLFECINLIDVKGLKNWNVANVTNMRTMFGGCTNLTSVDLSFWNMSEVTDDISMFEAAGFTTLIMPNNYTRIDNFMFNHNSSYTGESFTMPRSVTIIGNSHIFYDFGQDNSFKKFIVESGSTSLKTIDDILYSYDGTRLISIPRGKTFVNRTYEMPEGLTFMNELSFSRNQNIDTLILPNSYVIERYIKGNTSYDSNDNNNYGFVNSGNSLSIAIYQYTSVKKYEVKNDNTRYMSYEGCIYSKDGIELIAVPLHYSGILNIKAGTTTIGQEAFWVDGKSSIDSITAIKIPASVTTIEANQLTTLNSLMSRSTNPVTITIDSGNTAYQISGNKIVAK